MPENPVPDQDPPLVDVKVTNPVTYLKKWWNKVIGNEGMEFRFRVKPLTAIAISLVVVTVAFGLGQVDPTITTKPVPTPFAVHSSYLFLIILLVPKWGRATS